MGLRPVHGRPLEGDEPALDVDDPDALDLQAPTLVVEEPDLHVEPLLARVVVPRGHPDPHRPLGRAEVHLGGRPVLQPQCRASGLQRPVDHPLQAGLARVPPVHEGPAGPPPEAQGLAATLEVVADLGVPLDVVDQPLELRDQVRGELDRRGRGAGRRRHAGTLRLLGPLPLGAALRQLLLHGPRLGVGHLVAHAARDRHHSAGVHRPRPLGLPDLREDLARASSHGGSPPDDTDLAAELQRHVRRAVVHQQEPADLPVRRPWAWHGGDVDPTVGDRLQLGPDVDVRERPRRSHGHHHRGARLEAVAPPVQEQRDCLRPDLAAPRDWGLVAVVRLLEPRDQDLRGRPDPLVLVHQRCPVLVDLQGRPAAPRLRPRRAARPVLPPVPRLGRPEGVGVRRDQHGPPLAVGVPAPGLPPRQGGQLLRRLLGFRLLQVVRANPRDQPALQRGPGGAPGGDCPEGAVRKDPLPAQLSARHHHAQRVEDVRLREHPVPEALRHRVQRRGPDDQPWPVAGAQREDPVADQLPRVLPPGPLVRGELGVHDHHRHDVDGVPRPDSPDRLRGPEPQEGLDRPVPVLRGQPLRDVPVDHVHDGLLRDTAHARPPVEERELRLAPD